MATAISFDANNLQTASGAGGLGIATSDIQHESLANKNANIYGLAHANRSSLPFVNYPSRQVTIKGYIKGSSIADTDSKVDAFKAYFNKKEGNLDIGYNSGTRRYIATVQGIDIDPDNGLTVREFTVVFICSIPFGQNTSASTFGTVSGNTAATTNVTGTLAGTAPYQLPVITITVTAVTGGDGYVVLTNHANGQGITLIGNTLVNGDVIVIDVQNRKVTLNGIEIDYLGSFPEVAPGSAQFDYADGFTTRTVTINITYNAYYQ